MEQKKAIGEEEFIKIIDKINDLLNIFDEKQKENFQVVMLVGRTGNGKSTLFNFLSGFDLVITKQGKARKLDLKYPFQNGSSIMKGGMKSITKEPHYYLNIENKHILIDFPGFQDTQGNCYQDSYQNSYVVKQSDEQINSRGGELQEFISQCFAQEIKNFSQITLFLNSYMGDHEDEDLIDIIKKDFEEINQKPNKNIVVIKKINSEEDIQEYFNIDKRKQLWKVIQNSNSIKFNAAQLQKNAELADFVNKKCQNFTTQLVQQICDSLDKQMNVLEKEKMVTLLDYFSQVGLLIQLDMSKNIYGWYSKLIDISQKIAILLGCKQELKTEISNFFRIFQFLSQEQDIIDTQIILKGNSQIIKTQLITQEKTIRYKLTFMENEAKAKRDQDQRYMDISKIFEQQIKLEQIRHENQLQLMRQNRSSSSSCSLL